MSDNFTIIADDKCWIEQSAVNQLKKVASLPGVTKVIGLPDLHPGKLSPVGIAVETENIIYPHLIGNDIGCAIALFSTNCTKKKFKMDRFYKKLNEIQSLRDIEIDNPWADENCPIPDLGTIGGGNHFAEFQCVEKIYDTEAFDELELKDQDQILLLIHSGSRSYGDKIFNEVIEKHGMNGLTGDDMKDYLQLHYNAGKWAVCNRTMIARKLTEYLGYSTGLEYLMDCEHNYITRHICGSDRIKFIHRKGVVSGRNSLVVIPGSRGSMTYIVEPCYNDHPESIFSLSHGAGRKWIRSMCKGRLMDKYRKDEIHETRIGSRTICHETNLLYEEAPEAYKNIDNVIECLVNNNLCRVIATLRPLITFKA